MALDRDRLERLVAKEIARPVAGEIVALADAARARHEGGGGVRAVLAYGSTLRGVDTHESLVDLYVLTADFTAVSDSAFSRVGCRLAPPNVYYLEAPFGGEIFRAKYSCLPLTQFSAWMGVGVANPYFWARFAQPCRLVWALDETARREVIAGLATAVETMLAAGLSVAEAGNGWREIWTGALRATYGSELRVESATRADDIVARNENYFREAAAAVLGDGFMLTEQTARPHVNWRVRRILGKAWSVARLTKAAFTFAGGADYLAWKIERHSGVRVEPTDWQRRHPVLAALWLLPRLLRKGAVR